MSEVEEVENIEVLHFLVTKGVVTIEVALGIDKAIDERKHFALYTYNQPYTWLKCAYRGTGKENKPYDNYDISLQTAVGTVDWYGINPRLMSVNTGEMRRIIHLGGNNCPIIHIEELKK